MRFRKWVTAEVLPALRKTGRYEAKPVDGEMIPPPTEPRDFPGWPMDEWRIKIATTDRYDRMFGKLAGQWIMRQLGFPEPPRHLVEVGRQFDLFNAFPAEIAGAAE